MHFHRGDEIDVFYANADNYTIASNGTGCSGLKDGSPNTKRQKNNLRQMHPTKTRLRRTQQKSVGNANGPFS